MRQIPSMAQPDRFELPVFLKEYIIILDSSGHHLILGRLTDYLTGEILDDTHDERFRQKIARLLVESRGYSKTEIATRILLPVQAGELRAVIKVDFSITINSRILMVIQYGPGSLVTRQRPALAISRMIAPYQVPMVIVTNGEDADVIRGDKGRVLAGGLDAIPRRAELLSLVSEEKFALIPPKRFEMESRILYAFEVDGRCPCDMEVCRPDEEW